MISPAAIKPVGHLAESGFEGISSKVFRIGEPTGAAFVMGTRVKCGFYGEHPSLDPQEQFGGDTAYNNDLRGLRATLLDDWVGIDHKPILGGNYEQFDMTAR